jgi:peptidoglycan/xylan/chitin deacetylase (PgdA/CDA1 family)
MRLVSPFLKHVLYPGLSHSGYLHGIAATGPAVVTYHGILPVGYEVIDSDLDGSLVRAESFREQLQFLADHHNVISHEEFLLWSEGKQELAPRSVLLTCDDGLRNALTDVLPILQEFGFSCLFFVTGDSLSEMPTMLWHEELYLMFLAAPCGLEIGAHTHAAPRQGKRASWWQWVRKLSSLDVDSRSAALKQIRMQLGLSERWDSKYHEEPACARRFLTLNRDELFQLAAAGMCIGAHTMSHPVLSQSPRELAWSEISESRSGLEQALGQRIWALAYPFGDSSSVTSRELQLADQAGFKCAFVNVGGGFGAQTPRFAFPRIHVTAEMSTAEFEAHISGVHRLLRQWFTPRNEFMFVGES